MKLFICKVCEKQFATQDALNGHGRAHRENKQPEKKRVYEKRPCPETGELLTIKTLNMRAFNVELYYKNPVKCKTCNSTIKWISRNNIFCGKLCANKSREYTEKTREKISKGLAEYHFKRVKVEKHAIKSMKKSEIESEYKNTQYEFSKIYSGKCAHCKTNFYSRKNSKYCKEHSNLYKSGNRNKYAFTFNVFDYPELFDLDLVKELGFYSAGGKYKKNLNGLTRDHKVSVNEAIKNNYDPYYIKHPLNCELMSFKDNSKKKTRSSITYENLVLLVDEWLSERASNPQTAI